MARPDPGPVRTDSRVQCLSVAACQEYAQILRAAARRAGPDLGGADLDEVVQRGLLRLQSVLERGQLVEHLPAFLYRMGTRIAIDLLRELERRHRHEREAALAMADSVEDPEQVGLGLALAEAIEASLCALPARRAEVLRLHLMGYRPDEIGAALGLSWLNTRNLLYRGLRQLKAQLQMRGYDYG